MGWAEARRVRVYSPFFPFPSIEGGRWVVAEQVRALAALGMEVELVTWMDTPERIRESACTAVPRELKAALAVRHLGKPEFGARLVGGWGENSEDVGHGARQESGGDNTQPADRRWGSETRAGRLRRVARALASGYASPELFHYPPAVDLREELPPSDLGIYHYSFAHSWLTSGTPAPEHRIVVHVHNLESRIAGARTRTAGGISSLLHRRNARILKRHERELGGAVDELWFVSRSDLRDWAGTGDLCAKRFVPPTFPDIRHRNLPAGATGETVLGFVGTLDFEPNLRGVEWLVRELAPRLAAQSRPPRVVVAGHGLPDGLRREGERWGFFDFRGFVEDLETFWSGITALLVPDLHGIGVRIKLLESVARGIHTITHPAAAAALAPDVAESPLLTVANDPAGWAEAITGLGSRTDEAERPLSLEGREVYAFLNG